MYTIYLPIINSRQCEPCVNLFGYCVPGYNLKGMLVPIREGKIHGGKKPQKEPVEELNNSHFPPLHFVDSVTNATRMER